MLTYNAVFVVIAGTVSFPGFSIDLLIFENTFWR